MTNRYTPNMDSKWFVAYNQRFPEWHPRSQPHIIDSNGNEVISPPQRVNHPGMEDTVADSICQKIVDDHNFYLSVPDDYPVCPHCKNCVDKV